MRANVTGWVLLATAATGFSVSAWAFGASAKGCSADECGACHTLTREEARTLLKDLVHEVLRVEPSPVPGLWVADIEDRRGRRGPIYIDFSKRFVISGTVLELATRRDLARERAVELNRIDPSIIPLDDAVVMGDPKAPYRIVVFTDPDCPYCRRLHGEIQEVLRKRPDVAFYIKMFPLKKKTREKARAVICSKSRELLDAVMAGRPVPPADCATDQVDRNLRLGRRIGVRSTPTLVFPDGRVIPGAKPADEIIRLLESTRNAPESKTVMGSGGKGVRQ